MTDSKGKSSKVTKSQKTTEVEFEQGEQVEHPKWGVGTIIYKQGSGENQKLLILFPEEGQKKVLASLAKLKKVT